MEHQLDVFKPRPDYYTVEREKLPFFKAELNFVKIDNNPWYIVSQIQKLMLVKNNTKFLKIVPIKNRLKTKVVTIPKGMATDNKITLKSGIKWLVNSEGVKTILMESRSIVAKNLRKLMVNKMLDISTQIKVSGGYGIKYKRPKYVQAKKEATASRNESTLYLKDFIDYAKRAGSKSAGKYYILATRAVNKRVGVSSKSIANELQLHQIQTLESVITMHLEDAMLAGVNYHTAFKNAIEQMQTVMVIEQLDGEPLVLPKFPSLPPPQAGLNLLE